MSSLAIDGATAAKAVQAALPGMSFAELLAQAEALTLTLKGRGARVTYSRKVFIPRTNLCRDLCHDCTFATTPAKIKDAYLSLEQVLEIARAGRRFCCREVLFCSRSATGPKRGSARRASHSPRSGTRRRSATWGRRRAPSSTRPGCSRISILT